MLWSFPAWPRRPLALACLLAAAWAAPAQAETPSITVRGQASTEIPPDAANLAVSVDAERPTADAAATAVALAAGAVAGAIRDEQIAGPDVHTSAVLLTPIYSDSDGKARTASSYRASMTYAVTVRPAEKAGLVVAHLIDKGATGVDSLSYTSREQDSALDALRAEAAKDARRQAQVYAGALGLTVGPVLEIAPDAGAMTFSRMAASAPRVMAKAAATPALPLVPEPIHLSSAVTVRFGLTP